MRIESRLSGSRIPTLKTIPKVHRDWELNRKTGLEGNDGSRFWTCIVKSGLGRPSECPVGS